MVVAASLLLVAFSPMSSTTKPDTGLTVLLPATLHINRHAPNTLRLHAAGQSHSAALSGTVSPTDPDAFGKLNPATLRWPLPHRAATLEGEVFVCGAARGLCQMHRFKVNVPTTQRGPLTLSAAQVTGELLR